MRARYALPLGITAACAASVGYASLVERNWFRLRRYEIPLLECGQRPIRILHLSDTHLTPGRRHLIDWVRSLDRCEPDLVVNTGDSIAHPDAIPAFMSALEPLLDRPGVWVYGSNDLFAPRLKNPARYLRRTSRADYRARVPELPYRELGAAMRAAGWSDLNNRTTRLRLGGLDVEVAGIDDSHIGRDRYGEIAGSSDPTAALRIGVMHAPEPRNLDAFAAEGFQLLLAGHTHGGQLRVPGYGALVSNCGLDPRRARGLHRHGNAWLHVTAGLGTSPYAPVRFGCPPEASLLTLRARTGPDVG